MIIWFLHPLPLVWHFTLWGNLHSKEISKQELSCWNNWRESFFVEMVRLVSFTMNLIWNRSRYHFLSRQKKFRSKESNGRLAAATIFFGERQDSIGRFYRPRWVCTSVKKFRRSIWRCASKKLFVTEISAPIRELWRAKILFQPSKIFLPSKKFVLTSSRPSLSHWRIRELTKKFDFAVGAARAKNFIIRGVLAFPGRFSYNIQACKRDVQKVFVLLAKFGEFVEGGRLTDQGFGQTLLEVTFTPWNW